VRWVGLAVLVLAVAALGVVGWLVFGPGPLSFAGGNTVTLGDYQGPSPTGAPPSLVGASLVAKGKYLAEAADCEACHTVPGHARYAGGLAFKLPFGTLYTPNITADKETGIGGWNDADFLRAVHKGIAPDGTRLYPAFPYAAYSMMTDEDALAIKAYLFSLPAVRAKEPKADLAFPYNQRWLMIFWSLFFDPNTRFRPNTARSAAWNRGAYLAEAMGHCGDCHTPRNLLMALDNRDKFKGAIAAGWTAYDITPDKASGIGTWSDATLVQYLGNGHAAAHGTASGPMGEAVDNSLSQLVPDDIKAIVVYLRSVPPIADPALPEPRTAPAPASATTGPTQTEARGAAIFSGACASCHGWTGESPVLSLATFLDARAVNDPSARNVVQAIVWGVRRKTQSGPVIMPAFGDAYSNVEIAALANYVTRRFGDAPSAITADQVVQIRGQVSQ
jgi:mono/diheme cytochrome c family protein